MPDHTLASVIARFTVIGVDAAGAAPCANTGVVNMVAAMSAAAIFLMAFVLARRSGPCRMRA